MGLAVVIRWLDVCLNPSGLNTDGADAGPCRYQLRVRAVAGNRKGGWTGVHYFNSLHMKVADHNTLYHKVDKRCSKTSSRCCSWQCPHTRYSYRICSYMGPPNRTIFRLCFRVQSLLLGYRHSMHFPSKWRIPRD